jgi:predicted permease
MRLPDILRMRWRSMVLRYTVEQELDEELRYHVERQIEADIAAGVSPAEARRAALQSVCGLAQRREECRDARGWNMFDNLLHDFRFAARQLRKSPAFTVTAVLMLALGLCASVSIFAFVDAALLHPLPYTHPERVVGVFGQIPLCPQCNLSYPDFLDIKRLNTVFSSMDAYNGQGFLLRTPDGVELARAARVTAGFFRTLGVAPVAGRDFQDGEDQPAAPYVTILSYTTWQNRYGGRRDVLGQTVVLNGKQAVVVGVLPAEFHFAPLGQPEFWTPLRAEGNCDLRRSCHGMYGVARLRDGVSLQAAAANVSSIARELERMYPASNTGQGTDLQSITEVMVGNVRPILWVLLTGAGLLLLIAAANVAGLLLVRAESRQREIAVRSGLGASRARLLGQFAAEGALLTSAGAGLGVAGAHWTMQALVRLIPKPLAARMPYLQHLGLTPRLLGFAAAIVVMAAFLFTLIPATRSRFADLRSALAEGGRGSAGTVWRRLGSNLVVLELATAVILLAGAGLLSKSLHRLLQVDLGVDPRHLATMRVLAPMSKYGKDEQALALQRQVVSAMEAIPGVESAALASTLPVQSGNSVWIEFEGRAETEGHNEVSYRAISPEYFTTMRAKLVQGRLFSDADDISKPHVAIIDRSLARKFFPGQNPVGKRIRYKSLAITPLMEIVGIVADIKEGALDKENWPALYVAMHQEPRSDFDLVVRASRDEQAVLADMAGVLRQIDRSITATDPRSMNDRINQSPAAYLRRSSAWLVGGFAALALLLGVIGLYGVIAYTVSARTREIGVRIALGAQPGAVYQLVLGQAGKLIAGGVIVGLGAAIGLAGLMSTLLFGVESWDLPTLGAVAVVLAFCGLLAAFQPAKRAASLNPVEALRAE